MDSTPVPQTNRGNHLLAAVISILVLEIIVFGLRLVSRGVNKIPLGADDVFIYIAFPIIVGLDACLIAMVTEGGAGRHLKAILATDGPGPISKFLKLQVAVAELYFLILAFPKLSIISLYLRIFTQRPYQIICRILQVLLILYPLAWCIALLAICSPVRTLWSIEPPPGAHCGDISNMERYISVLNIITDVVMILLPIRMMWQVQLSLKSKIGIVITLCAGGMGLIVACFRFSIFFRSDISFTDITWVAVTVGTATSLEAGGYFIAACVPALRPILDFSGRFGSSMSLKGLFSSLRSRPGQSEPSIAPSRVSGTSLERDDVSTASTKREIEDPERGFQKIELREKANEVYDGSGQRGTYVSQVEAQKHGNKEKPQPAPEEIAVQYEVHVTRVGSGTSSK